MANRPIKIVAGQRVEMTDAEIAEYDKQQAAGRVKTVLEHEGEELELKNSDAPQDTPPPEPREEREDAAQSDEEHGDEEAAPPHDHHKRESHGKRKSKRR